MSEKKDIYSTLHDSAVESNALELLNLVSGGANVNLVDKRLHYSLKIRYQRELRVEFRDPRGRTMASLGEGDYDNQIYVSTELLKPFLENSDSPLVQIYISIYKYYTAMFGIEWVPEDLARIMPTYIADNSPDGVREWQNFLTDVEAEMENADIFPSVIHTAFKDPNLPFNLFRCELMMIIDDQSDNGHECVFGFWTANNKYDDIVKLDDGIKKIFSTKREEKPEPLELADIEDPGSLGHPRSIWEQSDLDLIDEIYVAKDGLYDRPELPRYIALSEIKDAKVTPQTNRENYLEGYRLRVMLGALN